MTRFSEVTGLVATLENTTSDLGTRILKLTSSLRTLDFSAVHLRPLPQCQTYARYMLFGGLPKPDLQSVTIQE